MQQVICGDGFIASGPDRNYYVAPVAEDLSTGCPARSGT